MEAARAAKIKGHDVTLFEKSGALGGQFVTASFPPYKGDFAPYAAWLIRQLGKLGIDIKLNTELTPEIVDKQKPDKVIIATGGMPMKRSHRGEWPAMIVHAEDVLTGKKDCGMNVLVVGGGMIGSETAAFLGTMCKSSVAISTRQSDVGGDMDTGIKDDLKELLRKNFVKVFTKTKFKELTEDGAIMISNGEEWLYPCDTVVAAFGVESYNPLADKLIGRCETVTVGDALQARKALEAVREGFTAGLFA
jgi:NADPH-dependent 2,4-dienoyl-CoA reductase/sulfur reductase-like enzyme